MYSGDGYLELVQSTDTSENYNSVPMSFQIQAQCESVLLNLYVIHSFILIDKMNNNSSNIPDNKGDSRTSSDAWNEEYAKRLATFMKNSKNLLENIDKKHKSVTSTHINSGNINNERKVFAPELPTNTLIELEKKLIQLDDEKIFLKTNIEYDNSTKCEKKGEDQNLNSVKVAGELNEVKKCLPNKKHNFQEGLRIDALEDQLYKFKKQLKDKDEKVKFLRSELEIGKDTEKLTQRTHHNVVTDFNNEFPTNFNIVESKITNCTNIINGKKNAYVHLMDNNKTVHTNDLNNFNLEDRNNNLDNNKHNGTIEYLSIKDYNPNNPIALQNKINDLESQIQDLHEANELASNVVAKFRENKVENSYLDSHEIISELIIKNQILRNEVEKIRHNLPIINDEVMSSQLLCNELECLKRNLFVLKQQNNMLILENVKLKNILKNKGLASEIKIEDEDDETTEFDHELLFEKNVKKMKNDNCSYIKFDHILSNNSTDSIMSDVNREIEDLEFLSLKDEKPNKSQEFQFYNEIHDNILKFKNSDCEYLESKEYVISTKQKYQMKAQDKENKFSTFGRTAFAPRNGIDINIGDVVKFIRQGGRISKGFVHFIGHLPRRNDMYLGIELEVEDGKHDGIYEGKRYFQCQKNKGVFVAFNKIIMVYSKINK